MLEKENLTPFQIQLLLYYLTAEPSKRTVTDSARSLNVSKWVVTRTLDTLEKLNIVERLENRKTVLTVPGVKLAEKYQTEGLFPDGSILQISDKSEIVSDQICFLVQNSAFYLPEKALNDEQMLELIDFYAKRDYSVTAQGQKDADITNASVDDVESG